MKKEFEKRPNTGGLFAVKSKQASNFPDYRGDVLIQLSEFEIKDGMIEVSLSGWKKQYSGGTWLSLQAKKPWVKDEQAQPQKTQEIQDDDIPF